RLATEGRDPLVSLRRFLSQGGPGLVDAGEIALLFAGMLAPLRLPPRPWRERRWRVPLAAAVVATAGFVLALLWRFDLIQASALYGLRLALPPPRSVASTLHLIALCAL